MNYSTSEVPNGYICASCGKTNVKLWRRYQEWAARYHKIAEEKQAAIAKLKTKMEQQP